MTQQEVSVRANFVEKVVQSCSAWFGTTLPRGDSYVLYYYVSLCTLAFFVVNRLLVCARFILFQGNFSSPCNILKTRDVK